MELREWLIILGLALVTLIVIDGVRRLKRQRRVPRLDQVGDNKNPGNGEAAADGEDNWELPNGGARVVKPASYTQVQAKPKLQRQDHPGPSRVLAGLKEANVDAGTAAPGAGFAATAASRPVASAMLEAGSPTPSRAEASGASGGKEEQATSRTPGETAHSRSTERDAAAGQAETQAAQIEPEVDLRDTERQVDDSVTPERATVEQQDAQPASVAAAQRVDDNVERSLNDAHEATAEPASLGREVSEDRHEPTLSALDGEVEPVAETAPLAADPADHDPHHDEDERYRLVDLEGMGDSIKSGSRRMGESVQRFGLSIQQRLAKRREQKREEKARREQLRAEKAEREAQHRREAAEVQAAREAERRRLEAEAIELADDDDPLFAPPRPRTAEPDYSRLDYSEPVEQAAPEAEAIADDDVVRAHPTLARALRHNVNAERARDTLSQADEIIVISVLSRDEEGFSGEALLNLMLACGLRYSSDMGIFHRFETEDPESELQFSMVNVLKPGTFPIEAMDEFRTPGITLLMPLPGALDTAAAFEAMVETAMVIVRNLGGELKDENHSVMTAQTVEFARQRVQEFERRNRLNRYQVN
ncbi:cell division protein ZipA [Halomonas sp. MCCC 1A11036]|uniref:Cell division protein ZipA n=1 Tax=Billgrantia zhangzhouensis TaxID=2733481 RepID=A0ABS9AGI4_9GAMM|nr:cell division protein ZipA [Halomonas zhangzhouensis]MCE8020868.1 cell division protein ZipA [Halomonas zhangzhouensis]